MIKAIIFDLDGTLLNTLNDLSNAVNYGLQSCSFPLRSVEEVRNFVGNGVRTLIRRAVPPDTDENEYEKCFSAFSTYYLDHMTDVTVPYPGITDLLIKLEQKNISTAVVSNKLHKAVVGLCKDFFGDKLTCAYGVEIESERKPAPVNVYKAMKDLSVNADEVLYIGDSEVDVQTAENAGISCVGVSWGFRDKNILIDKGCKTIVDTAEELYNYIINYK